MPGTYALPPHAQLFLHTIWPASMPLGPDVVEKLSSYLTRYAQTIKTIVHAVGANKAGDALHLIIEWPIDKSIDEVISLLQKPAARYASATLGVTGLTWDGAEVESINPWDVDPWKARVLSGDAPGIGSEEKVGLELPEGEELPDWLTGMLERTEKP